MSAEVETLTTKQEAFIENIVKGMNKTQAVIAAGITSNYNSASVAGHKLFKDPRIQSRVQRRIQSGLSLSDEEIVGTLTEFMRGDITDCVNKDGSVDIDLIKKRGLGFLLSQLEVEERVDRTGKVGVRKTKVKMYSSQRAAEFLARIRGLDNHTQKIEVELSHKDEKAQIAHNMVQAQLDLGNDLKTSLMNLMGMGVPAEVLALVNAENLNLNPIHLLTEGDYTEVEQDEDITDYDSTKQDLSEHEVEYDEVYINEPEVESDNTNNKAQEPQSDIQIDKYEMHKAQEQVLPKQPSVFETQHSDLYDSLFD